MCYRNIEYLPLKVGCGLSITFRGKNGTCHVPYLALGTYESYGSRCVCECVYLSVIVIGAMCT